MASKQVRKCYIEGKGGKSPAWREAIIGGCKTVAFSFVLFFLER